MEVKTRKSAVNSRCSMKTTCSISTQPPPPQKTHTHWLEFWWFWECIIFLFACQDLLGTLQLSKTMFRGWNWLIFRLLKKNTRLTKKNVSILFSEYTCISVLSVTNRLGKCKTRLSVCQFETLIKFEKDSD